MSDMHSTELKTVILKLSLALNKTEFKFKQTKFLLFLQVPLAIYIGWSSMTIYSWAHIVSEKHDIPSDVWF